MVNHINLWHEQFNGLVIPFRRLPVHIKKAIYVYYTFELEHVIRSDDVFGYIEVPIEVLTNAIGCPQELGYANFDEYHKWYIEGGDIPQHESLWPIILSGDAEIILDGWHRFHSYVDKGIQVVPCVYPIKVKSIGLNKEL